METKNFITEVRKSVIDENLILYKDMFTNTVLNKVTDKYWAEALGLFNKLDANDRDVFFKIIRQISVDTTSNILGIIDGVSWLEGQESEFELQIEGKIISGDLQDVFLEIEENN